MPPAMERNGVFGGFCPAEDILQIETVRDKYLVQSTGSVVQNYYSFITTSGAYFLYCS